MTEPVAPSLGLGPPICMSGVIMSCLQVVVRTQWDQSWISLMLGSLPHLGVTAAPEAPQDPGVFHVVTLLGAHLHPLIPSHHNLHTLKRNSPGHL